MPRLLRVQLLRYKVLIGCAVVVVGLPAFGKVAPTSFDRLIAKSDVIVVAEVDAVEQDANGYSWATATVKEARKGSPSRTFRFFATGAWTCDISHALKGETVVLFLLSVQNREWVPRTSSFSSTGPPVTRGQHSLVIAHSGRGRMPVSSNNGEEYVRFWGDVDPGDLPAIGGRRPYRLAVPLASLRRKIQARLSTSQP